MAHFPNQHGAAQTDAYGNLLSKDAYGNVNPTDEFGNPIHHSGTTDLQGGHQQQRHDVSGTKLHRSGSSSSSSEDDGQGGRRKKGLKEKIKEKIPGVGNKDNRNDTSCATGTNTYTQTGGYGTGEQAQHQNPAEKKGMMEKIKEKLPGNRTSSDQAAHHQNY